MWLIFFLIHIYIKLRSKNNLIQMKNKSLVLKPMNKNLIIRMKLYVLPEYLD